MRIPDAVDAVTACGTHTASCVAQVPADFVMEESNAELLDALAAVVWEHGDERTKARAVMCVIYFKAIHGDFYASRNLLLMSHLQVSSIVHNFVHTSIHFHRHALLRAPLLAACDPPGRAS